MSENKVLKGIKDTIRDFIYIDLFPPRTGTDIVSSNTKVVLYGLFALVGFAILTYAITVSNYNTDDIIVGKKSVPLNDSQRVERLEQLEQINGVYIAAISGALALGGTLISQLWGKNSTTTTPIIYATNPDDTANGVPVDTSISASFNMMIDKSTINSKTFTLKDTSLKDTDANSIVNGAITVEGGMQYLDPLVLSNH